MVYTNKQNRVIMLTGDIEYESIHEINKALLEFELEDNEKESKEIGFERKPVKFYIDSYGGWCIGGKSITSMMLSMKTPVDTYCTGFAYSCGLFIYLAGRKRYATKAAEFLLHDASNTYSGFMGDIKLYLQHTDKMMEYLVELVTNRTSITGDMVKQVFSDRIDKYFQIDEAVELGIVTDVI